MDNHNASDEKVVYIDLRPYFMRVVRSWKRILAWAVCGALIGVAIGFSKPRTYTSTAIVAPEIATRSTLSSGVSTLASLAGVNVNSLAMTDAMHPSLYPTIIGSTDFSLGLLEMPVSFVHSGALVRTDLYDYLLNYTQTPWYAYLIGLPRMAVGAVTDLFKKKDAAEVQAGLNPMDSLCLTKQQAIAVKTLSRAIKVNVDKRTFGITIQATLQDRIIAAQLANAIVERLQQFVVGYRTKKEQDNVDYFEKLYAETHDAYMAAQRAYARYADANLGSLSRSSQVERQHLQNEAQIKYQMYHTTAQNLLSARAKVQQEAPVLLVIQNAKAPVKGKPSRARLAMVWLILGGIAGTVAAAFFRKEDGEIGAA